MSFTRVPVQLWMQLDIPRRNLIAEDFGLKKTGITEVRDQEVLTDGYSNEDLAEITAEKMEAYVGSKETFPRLWELTCAKAHSKLHPPVGVINTTVTTPPEPVDETITQSVDDSQLIAEESETVTKSTYVEEKRGRGRPRKNS